jgi:hypothetical protein
VRIALALFVIAYLPGAILFRLPVAERVRRARLGADERVFWHVTLSVAWSLIVVLLLAAAGEYRFNRLLLLNATMCGSLVLYGRTRLLYHGDAARPSLTAVLPIVLIVSGLWRFFPASEYIIGGKDPGTYMSEGIQIAQRGALIPHDPVVAAVPDYARDLFFPMAGVANYYLRFMGFFVQEPHTGRVIGQFPHLFPASIAIGYGVYGLTGARFAVEVWALLGLVAVYFAGAHLVGRVPAAIATALVSLNVMEVWFARYPNAEFAMQALLFATVLAFTRAHQDEDRFFGPVAGVLAGLLIFIRIDALLAIIGILAAAVLSWLVDRRPLRIGFLATIAVFAGAGGLYLTGPMRAYVHLPQIYLGHLPMAGVVGASIAAVVLLAGFTWLARRRRDRARLVFAFAVAGAAAGLAVYAYFFRHAGGKLTEYDAHALRDFVTFYLGPTASFRYLPVAAFCAVLAGLFVVARRSFWREPALVLTVLAFSAFLFYKIRIVPEHFWAARRFLPVILPGALLFAAAAAFGVGAADQERSTLPSPSEPKRSRLYSHVRWVVGGMFMGLVGWQYLVAAAPVMPHVEYAGMIPYLERLAARFGDRDLVLVESRDAGSDTHVFALPLAYIYGRHVLVLSSPRPDKMHLRAFLEDSQSKYDRIFFVGGGGTDLLSRHIAAVPVAGEKIQVPEYASAVVRAPDGVPVAAAYPTGVRFKEFDYGIYQLTVGDIPSEPFILDVGYRDDLNVIRFNAKETTGTPEGPRTIRWTNQQSFVAIPGMRGQEREVVLVMHDGGRPKQATPAKVEAFLDLPCVECEGKVFEVSLGSVSVGPDFRPYRFAIPPEAASRAATLDDPAIVKLISTVWNPQRLLGGPDNRNLGVMLDRVEVH